MTLLLRRLHSLAKRHHLPNALGRAIVLVSRHYNDGFGNGQDEDELAFMRRVRPETAKRWLLHWSNGGSLKALRYSREEMSARRKKERSCASA